jgi:hypothetical protein
MNSFDGTTSTIVVQSTPTVMNNESKTFKAWNRSVDSQPWCLIEQNYTNGECSDCDDALPIHDPVSRPSYAENVKQITSVRSSICISVHAIWLYRAIKKVSPSTIDFLDLSDYLTLECWSFLRQSIIICHDTTRVSIRL